MHPQSEVTVLRAATNSDGKPFVKSELLGKNSLCCQELQSNIRSSRCCISLHTVAELVAAYARYAQLDDLLQYLPEDALTSSDAAVEEEAEISFA